MFTNREQAAHLLAQKLKKYKGRKDLLVLAIPRGAVGMGKIIASKLSAPFDIIVVKKIGAPNNPELAMGAVGPHGTVYWDLALCRGLHVDKRIRNYELGIMNREREEREVLLRGKKPYPKVQGKTVIVIDDGVATGATSIAIAKFLRKNNIKKSILATPVIATDTLSKVRRYFDEVVYLLASSQFQAVGQFYEEFEQVSDSEVISLLKSNL